MEKMEIENTILVIIDVQDKLFNVLKDKSDILESTVKLIKGVSSLGMPIIITEQYPKGIGKTVKEISGLLLEVRPIEKMSFSCMGEDVFRAEVEKTGRKNVIICGIETHVCIYQTAMDLLSEGYNVIVAVDCVSSRSKINKKTAITKMAGSGANITTSEMALFELIKSANHPKFKEISKIVK